MYYTAELSAKGILAKVLTALGRCDCREIGSYISAREVSDSWRKSSSVASKKKGS